MKKIVFKAMILFNLFLLACQEPIVHNLSELEANHLITRLYASGLQPQKRRQADGKWSISVSDKESLKAISLLDENRVLKNYSSAKEYSQSLFASRVEQKFSYEQMLASKIEHTIKSIPGVLEVHVILNLNANVSIWSQETEVDDSSASVLLIVSKSFLEQSASIQEVVSGAAGIAQDKVTVLITDSSKPISEIKTHVELRANGIQEQNVESTIKYLLLLSLLTILVIFLLKRKKIQNLRNLLIERNNVE